MIQPSLSGPWSIGEGAFVEVVRDMTEVRPGWIVEFGSGASSVRLAKAFPGAQVLSIESSEEFFERSLDCSRHHGIGPPRLSIELRPLRFRRIAGAVYETYDWGPFPSRIDAVLIDGPPHWTGRGRQACLYDVASRLRVGGRVYLDDCQRDQERLIVRNWVKSYPHAFRVSGLSVGHGLAVLEKLVPISTSPRVVPCVALDAWIVHAKRRVKLLRNALTRRLLKGRAELVE
jgi:hypothetical protein